MNIPSIGENNLFQEACTVMVEREIAVDQLLNTDNTLDHELTPICQAAQAARRTSYLAMVSAIDCFVANQVASAVAEVTATTNSVNNTLTLERKAA